MSVGLGKGDSVPTQLSTIEPDEEDEIVKAKSLEMWLNDRAELLTWRPFLGILAMNLDLVPVVDSRCVTACTDGRRIFFNPYFISNLSDNERISILAHEIWHCGLLHFTREVGRIDQHKAWNYAIDHEVNSLLSDDGFSMPRGSVLYEEHRGLSAEQIFEKIISGELNLQGEIIDDHLSGPNDNEKDEPAQSGQKGTNQENSELNGDSDSDLDEDGDDESSHTGVANRDQLPEKYGPLIIDGDEGVQLKRDKNFTPQRSDEIWKEWRGKMLVAAQQCQARGNEIGNYESILGELSGGKMPWREILRQFITPIFGGARQWLPPNRRYVSQGIYLPSRRQQELLKILVVIDTSGSTIGSVVRSFMEEVNAIINAFGGYEMTLLQIDERIQDEQIYSTDNPFNSEDFRLKGGGGTRFEPAFDYAREELNNDIKAMIYMTDGYGSAPSDPPPYPVLWVLCEGGIKPTEWGGELQIPPEI